jgi:LemA protein
MPYLPGSPLSWIAGAIVLFWFVGAYNRLVRLRSAARKAYGALDAALTRQLEFVLAGAARLDPAAQTSHSGPLLATARQFSTLLAATRLRPLEPARMTAMSTALHVMLAAWRKRYPGAVVSFDADGVLSRASAPEHRPKDADAHATPIAWPKPSASAEMARRQFNHRVVRYNMAIAEFPTVLVAWVMQFKRAAPLL